jgi:hypothetical protein
MPWTYRVLKIVAMVHAVIATGAGPHLALEHTGKSKNMLFRLVPAAAFVAALWVVVLSILATPQHKTWSANVSPHCRDMAYTDCALVR